MTPVLNLQVHSKIWKWYGCVFWAVSLSPVPLLFLRLLAEEKSRLFSERSCPQVLAAETSFINEAHVSCLFSLFLFATLSRRNFSGRPRGKWNMYSICLSLRTS